MADLPILSYQASSGGGLGSFGGFGDIIMGGLEGLGRAAFEQFFPIEGPVVGMTQPWAGPPAGVPGVSPAQLAPVAFAGGGGCVPGPRLPSAVIVDDPNPCRSPQIYKKMGAVSTAITSGSFREHRRINKLAQKARRPGARRKR